MTETPAITRTDRPVFPDGYGLPTTTDTMLTWAEVESRLVASKAYWLATTRPDGSPHVVPRWGVWVDGRLWYDGASTTRHAQNLASNPACALHLESGNEVVIVEGRSDPTSAPAETLGVRLAKAFEKYHADGYSPEADAWSDPEGGGLRVLTPHRALAWFSFPSDATRFRFA
jgi:nitroimidazol reductase NimA-like FMN-containing flavoprotein (pyridoxamine 5'-phosphate oxidase superfamily)